MSAFMVSDFHINAMVTFAAAPVGVGLGAVRPGEEQAVAGLLHAANRASIRARYGRRAEQEIPEGIRYAPTRVVSPCEFNSACSCFDYQACEGFDYRETEAARLVDGWMAAARGQGVEGDGGWELMEKAAPRGQRAGA